MTSGELPPPTSSPPYPKAPYSNPENGPCTLTGQNSQLALVMWVLVSQTRRHESWRTCPAPFYLLYWVRQCQKAYLGGGKEKKLAG